MTSTDQPLQGKIILITGGASGIGLSLTQQSHALGAKILVADLNTTPTYEAFAANKPNIHFTRCDVSSWRDLQNLFRVSEEKWNDVPDAYGICAGIFEPPFSNFWHDPEEDGGYKQVEVNVNHPIKLTRLAIRMAAEKGKKASVCIISSIGGLAGNLAAPLYCATKHAIIGFVKSMKDSAPLTGVKITTICPGLVKTPLLTSEKVTQFSVNENSALSPVQVADSMLELLQQGKYPCGTVLEISKVGTRVVPEWNVEAPTAEGTGGNVEEQRKGVDALLRPILERLEGERGRAKL